MIGIKRTPLQAPSASSDTVRLTLLCLGALVAGVAGGVLASHATLPGSGSLEAAAGVVVRAWTNAFRLLVAPLVVSQLYLATASGATSGREASRLGMLLAAVFVGLLVLTAAVSTALAAGLVNLPLFSGISLGAATRPTASLSAPEGMASTWVDGLIPPNLVAAATTDNILPLMLFALAFGLAMRHADAEAELTITRFARGVSQACFTLVGWLLRITPLVILALAYRSALSSGLDAGAAVLGYAGLEIFVIMVLLALLYPLTVLLGGVPLATLAPALWPAQLTALTTRSSLASLPALFRAAESTLRVRADTAAYVLPLAGATLKLSRAVSSPIKLLFLAHILGIPLTAEKLVIFAATIILLSAAVAGVPSVTTGNRSLPAYVAAGIPPEYVVLLGVAVNLTDAFLTVFNTTGYLSATAIVERLRGRSSYPAGDVAVAATAPVPEQQGA